MTLKNKTLKLRELIDMNPLIRKFYKGVNEWDKVKQLAEQVHRPINDLLKAHDDKLEQFREDVKANPDRGKEIDEIYLKMLNSDVEIKLAVITEDEVKGSGLKADELAFMYEYVTFEKPKKK